MGYQLNIFTGQLDLVGSEGSGGGVTSINGATGTVTLVAGSGISITPSGNNITIASSTVTFNKENDTLTNTNITNQYVDLAHVAKTNSISVAVNGVSDATEGIDYTVNYTGGVGGNTRISFINDLATGGNSALVAGDIFSTQYAY